MAYESEYLCHYYLGCRNIATHQSLDKIPIRNCIFHRIKNVKYIPIAKLPRNIRCKLCGKTGHNRASCSTKMMLLQRRLNGKNNMRNVH